MGTYIVKAGEDRSKNDDNMEIIGWAGSKESAEKIMYNHYDGEEIPLKRVVLNMNFIKTSGKKYTSLIKLCESGQGVIEKESDSDVTFVFFKETKNI